MSLFLNPIDDFLSKKTPTTPVAPKEEEQTWTDSAKSWIGNKFASGVQSFSNFYKDERDALKVTKKAITEGNLFNPEGFMRNYNEVAEERKKEENTSRIEAEKAQMRKSSIESTFLNGLKDDLQTTSPYKRKVFTNDIKTLVDKVDDIYETIDRTPGEMDMTNNIYGFKNKKDYKKHVESVIIPALVEIQKRKNKTLDSRGSRYAYSKMMEEDGSEELINKISDFSNELTADANTQALNQYWSEGRWAMGTLQAGVKVFDTARYGLDRLLTKTGIGNPNIVSDIKYTKGGSAQDSGAIAKNFYSATETFSDIWDGAPEIITNIVGFKGASGIESGVVKAENYIGSLGEAGYKIAQFNEKNPAALAFTKNMLSDTFGYDLVTQTFTGKPLTEEDVQLNLAMNLPINGAIGLMSRSPITGKLLAQQFDIKRTFNNDGTINITQTELDAIKAGRMDIAETMILSRSKVGGTEDIEGLINIRNLSGNKELAQKVSRVANNVTNTIKMAEDGIETAKQTLQLKVASDKILHGVPDAKLAKVLSEYDSQYKVIEMLSQTVRAGAEGDNVNKFWNRKVMEQVNSGNINIESALEKLGKTNPEYADAIAMFRKANNLGSGVKAFSEKALKTYGANRLKKTYGEMLQSLYKNEIVDASKLTDGERLSPIHVVKNGTVKNIETGETMDISDFFQKTNKTAYQKKAMNESVIDDMASNPELFEFFKTKLKGDTNTNELLQIFQKRTFSKLSEREAYLIRAALGAEIMQDLTRRGRATSLAAVRMHPAYRIFRKTIDGSYEIALDNLDKTDIAKTLGDMFKNMEEGQIVKYLADLKSQDQIITSLKTKGVKATVKENTTNQPKFLQEMWEGFSEMLMRKTETKPSIAGTYPKVSKETAVKMVGLLQKAFPNIKVEFGSLPENVRGSISAYEGKIIIDETKMGPFTSLHEFGHLWIMHAKAEEQELYESLSAMIQKTRYYKDVRATYGNYYKDDYQFIDEAIAHAIEDSGSKFFDSIERKTFMEKIQAMLTKIYNKIIGTAGIETEMYKIVQKLFNADAPISNKSLAELDILQFTKEDFDSNSYFIRHVIQKINEDNIFLTLAKKNQGIEQEELIFQIINSMIKNTVPSSAIATTVKNYTHGFDNYIKLVKRDAFTEAYIHSEVAKYETAQALRSMMPDAIKILKEESGIDIVGSEEIEKRAIEILGTELVRLAKKAGLKRLFKGGSVKNILDELKMTIDNIKNSDMPLHEKQRALIAQSYAYSNTYIFDTVLKNYKGEANKPKMTIGGTVREVDPNILYQALQVMRMPEFAASKLTISDYLKNDYIRNSLAKWSFNVNNIGKAIEADEINKVRLQSAIPVAHIPEGENVIVTLKGRSDDVTYARYEDEKGQYVTLEKFLKMELDPNKNYLIPVKFFNQSASNPEMTEMVKKIKDMGKNIYPVEFTVVRSGNAKYVEQDGFQQLSEMLSIKRSGTELPDFTFEHAPSVKGMSRISENTTNRTTRSELASIVDGTYKEATNAEKYLTDIGANPVKEPVVLEDELIHSLGELGKLGEIIRTALRSLIAKNSKDITDRMVQGTIITENVKQEWLASIAGEANLSEIYIGGKTLTEIADEELSNIDIDSLVEGLSKEDAEIARSEYERMVKESRGNTVKEELSKYSSGKEAFNAIIDTLIQNGKTYSEISEIVRTILAENKGWAKEVFESKAVNYIPSFDSFIANKLIAPILAKHKIGIDSFEKVLESEYYSTLRATFGSENNFANNDHIISLFIQTMQEQGILPSTLDTYAVIKNLLPEDRKHLHDVINNFYQGDIWKLIADENTSEYFKSTFKKLRSTFLGREDSVSGGFTSEDIQKGVVEFADEGDDSATTSTRILDEKDADTNMYEVVMGAFLPKLKDFNDYEAKMMSPKMFNIGESSGKPLYELEINLNTWASQPTHKVITPTPASVQSPKKDAETAFANAVKVKAYNVFNKRSQSTVLRFKEIDGINMFEKQEFESATDLEEALSKKGVTLTIGNESGVIGSSVKIDESLLEKIIKKIEEKAFEKGKGAEATVFTMTTKNGTPREYHIGNIMNSPIFRTLVEEFTDIVSPNAILQLLELNKAITKKIAKSSKLGNSALQSIGSSLRNIERKYAAKMSGGEQRIGLSTDIMEKEGYDMVANYLRGFVGPNTQIVEISHYTPINEVLPNGNSVPKYDDTMEKNTDASLNDYRVKQIDTRLQKDGYKSLDETMENDSVFILTEYATKQGTNGKEYTVKQPIEGYDFSFKYRDVDRKSPTNGKIFQVKLEDGKLSERIEVEEVIEKDSISYRMSEDPIAAQAIRDEICIL